MGEGQTLKEAANQQRWCMEKVPEGQEKWPAGASWHPMRGYCKGYGRKKINGEWRCVKHAPKEE